MNRSSRPEVFYKKGFLRNFAKFTGKQRLWHRCFSVNFAKFLRTPCLTEHLGWLLLSRTSLAITKKNNFLSRVIRKTYFYRFSQKVFYWNGTLSTLKLSWNWFENDNLNVSVFTRKGCLTYQVFLLDQSFLLHFALVSILYRKRNIWIFLIFHNDILIKGNKDFLKISD